MRETAKPEGAVTVIEPDDGVSELPVSEYESSTDDVLIAVPGNVRAVGRTLKPGVELDVVVPEMTRFCGQIYFPVELDVYHG